MKVINFRKAFKIAEKFTVESENHQLNKVLLIDGWLQASDGYHAICLHVGGGSGPDLSPNIYKLFEHEPTTKFELKVWDLASIYKKINAMVNPKKDFKIEFKWDKAIITTLFDNDMTESYCVVDVVIPQFVGLFLNLQYLRNCLKAIIDLSLQSQTVTISMQTHKDMIRFETDGVKTGLMPIKI